MGLFVILGLDILCLICENLGVSDIKNFCVVLSSTREYDEDLIDEVLTLRLSPVSYFGRAFSDPPLLLLAMLSHSIILSGPRATEYFYPNSRDSNSCWDFFVTADTLCMTSAVQALEECGVVWDYEASKFAEHGSVISRSEQSTMDHLEGHTIVKSRKHMIRLARESYRTAVDCVIRFGSSAAKCIIFGHGAVCLYKTQTKKDGAVFWSDGPSSYNATIVHNAAKNEARKELYIRPLPYPLCYRRLGDERWETVDFTPYFDIVFRPLIRYLNLVAGSKQWIEHEGTVTPLKFPLTLFGTIPSGSWTAPLDVENPSPIESMKRLPFSVYMDFGRPPRRQEQALENKTLRRFVNVGLGSAAEFFGNYTATLPI